SVTDLAFGDLVKKRRGGGAVDRRRYEDAAEAAHAPEPRPPVDLPIVPLGIPLIIGPGAITTILIAEGQFGAPVTLGTIALNLLLVFVAFTFGPRLMRVFGPDTSKAVAKVASLFLAAIAVAMIRAGIVGMVMTLQN
ncbi:MAG TPA: MarC family protein, partial [Rubricoccaceae bacterium]